uniref:Immunoglobulin superfamily member 11 n=1 Tax=Tetraodon nigroviridis TaxID=99883 RepID=H3C0Q4_TETNG
ALDVTVSQSSVQVARGQAAILPCSFTTSAALNNLNIIWMVIPLSNANQPEQVPKHNNGRTKNPQPTNPNTWVRVNILCKVCVYFQASDFTLCGRTLALLPVWFHLRGERAAAGHTGSPASLPFERRHWSAVQIIQSASALITLCPQQAQYHSYAGVWPLSRYHVKTKLTTSQNDQIQGTVTLKNISTSTSGLYQCTSSNAIGKSTCLLSLQVVEPQLQSVGLITGTIATGVFAVIICSVLVVVTIFYWKNKNKYDEEDVPNEIRFDDDLPPKRSSSVKAFHADASSSENDTLTSTNTYNMHPEAPRARRPDTATQWPQRQPQPRCRATRSPPQR